MEDRPSLTLAAQQAELQALTDRINRLLPPQYQDRYEDVQPVSMGSAALKYGPDGRVAWDDVWTTFCDLALAGGPPHRGTLLEPPPPEEASAEPDKYQAVVEEIGRGIWLVTGLPVLPRVAPGWVGVRCAGEDMAVWLTRAILAENVFVRRIQDTLHLPAGSHFRLEKEVKNVITAVAKTHHYWKYHLYARPKESVADLVEPASPAEAAAIPADYEAVVSELTRAIEEAVSLPALRSRYLGWVEVPCPDEETAVWLMRAVLVENVLVRREKHCLFLPASPRFAHTAQVGKVVKALAGACRLWDMHVTVNRPGQGKKVLTRPDRPA
jgi:hypothetical protein